MKLYEFEGKELFREMGIPVPTSEVAFTETEALEAAGRIGFPVMVKAQVLRGGRGKSGLVKRADDEQDLLALAREIISRIGSREGLLIEQIVSVRDEVYLGITVDDIEGVPVWVFSSEGGIDVEDAALLPGRLIRELIDPRQGLLFHRVVEALDGLGYHGAIVRRLADLAQQLYKVFLAYEADTVEVNPVMILNGDEVIVGDAKVILDDYAAFRNKALQNYLSTRGDDPENNTRVIYVPLDGNIGVISLGASNTMMLIDSIKCLGGKPANFADIASGVDYDTVYDLGSLVLRESRHKAKVVVVNLKLAGASLKTVVEGVRDAIVDANPPMPLIGNVQIAGAARLEMSAEEAIAELEKAGVSHCNTLEELISAAIALSRA